MASILGHVILGVCLVPELQWPLLARRRSAELYSAVSQIFNLQADRIYLRGLASLISLQDTILRYSEICATLRFGPQKPHLRNRVYQRSSSSVGSGYARLCFGNSFGFRNSLRLLEFFSRRVIFGSLPGGSRASKVEG